LATSVDPKGYLTSLNSVVLKTEAEIGDIKRARMLFDSLVKSNPKHAPGWIAAACLEEHAGRMVAARKLIKAGCEQCPKSDDVWLEAARLHVSETFVILCTLAHIPTRIMMMPRSFLPTPFNMSVRASKSGWQQPTSNKMRKRRNVSCAKVHILSLDFTLVHRLFT
jgi:hypothetical protein